MPATTFTTTTFTTTTFPGTTVPAAPAQVTGLRELFSGFGDDAPGCSAALAADGAVVWAEGFGLANLDTGEEITPATVFDIASTSKQFTATAALLLVDDGRLDLDAPLRSIAYDLPAWADEVTIRQLMHHTSDRPEYIGLLIEDGYGCEDRTTQEDALDALRRVEELDFEPGSEFEYSNSNYHLLGEVVARIAGESLPAFLDERVFTPLGLEMVMD